VSSARSTTVSIDSVAANVVARRGKIVQSPRARRRHAQAIAARLIMGNEQGLITIASKHPVHETAARIEAKLKAGGTTLFARIDHAAGAASVGMTMPPMQLLVFGNPRAGTPLMLAAPTFGIDLPLKLLVWQDAEARVWITYDAIAWLNARHGGVVGADKLQPLEAALHALAHAAGD
jgi:uncharacterized protein (DUF302 family)